MNFIVDKAKALKKWSPVLDSLKVGDEDKRGWMSEYAEMHQLNENVAYSTLGNLNGMGNVVAPGIAGNGFVGNVNAYTGNGSPLGTGSNGSGDIAQNLLPVSMKIAAQTIGLDLVAVKPASSPRIELLFVDFKYDNSLNNVAGVTDKDERPLVFKLGRTDTTAGIAVIAALKATLINAAFYGGTVNELIGGLDKRVFVHLTGGTGESYFVNGAAGLGGGKNPYAGTTEPVNTEASGRQGWLEFLGFSRVDGKPIFRAFRQVNTAANNGTTGAWGFINGRNTFPATTTSVQGYLSDAACGIELLFATTAATQATVLFGTGTTVELVSTMEDQIPGFSAGWNLSTSMSRDTDEKTYPGVIGPDVFTKAIAVGDIEISSALKRTQIEDIKASTGMDIVQKLESVLINELTQTISKQIVAKIIELAEENRASNTVPANKFDFNVDAYLALAAKTPGGETTHSIQRKLVAKINNASNFIATDGRVGPAQYLVTNGNLASVLQDIAGYTINPVNAGKLNTNGQLYPMGNIGNISIYVDPYMRWDDNRIFIGRKNSVDQPGLVFIPYLMAQSISLISEATWAPRMLIRSRYAISDIGFFPWKQYMSIHVTDTNGVLI